MSFQQGVQWILSTRIEGKLALKSKSFEQGLAQIHGQSLSCPLHWCAHSARGWAIPELAWFLCCSPFQQGVSFFFLSLQELLKDIKGTILSTRIEAGVSAQLTPEFQSFLFAQVLCFNLLVNFLDDFFVACRPDTADFHNQLGLCFFLLAAHDVGPLWLSCIGDAQLHPWPLVTFSKCTCRPLHAFHFSRGWHLQLFFFLLAFGLFEPHGFCKLLWMLLFFFRGVGGHGSLSPSEEAWGWWSSCRACRLAFQQGFLTTSLLSTVLPF